MVTPQYFRNGIITDVSWILSEIKRVEDQFSSKRQAHEYDAARVVNRSSKAEWEGKQFNVKSLRLRTFLHHGLTCSKCGLSGSFFAIERNKIDEENDAPYHLNLYGIDAEGVEVLFTHDHTLARSLGGVDNLSNTTTMCYPCNQDKALGEAVENAKLKGETILPMQGKNHAKHVRHKANVRARHAKMDT